LNIDQQLNFAVNIHVTDTCTIDYFLFGFWILSQIVPDFIRNIPELEKTDALKNSFISLYFFVYILLNYIGTQNIKYFK